MTYKLVFSTVGVCLLTAVSVVTIGHTREARQSTEAVAMAVANLDKCETDTECLDRLTTVIDTLVTLDGNLANRDENEMDQNKAKIQIAITRLIKAKAQQLITQTVFVEAME